MVLRPRPQDEDTICAQTSAQGKGGVAVIRISGPKALEISRSSCSFIPKNPESHRIFYGSFVYQDQVIDEVVVLFFAENKSFTSEPVIEICPHGNPIICQEILQALISSGCRMAERGEFTYRAFMSGRIDLIQAESILQVIEAPSLQAKKQALKFLRGDFSNRIQKIKNKTQELRAHIEANIDFSEENLSVISVQKIQENISEIDTEIKSMLRTYKQGLYVRDGLRVGIFGLVNAGKSTLLNSLLHEDRAIVSSIEGTTRDTVEGEKYIEGQKIYFIDTAGIRKTKDEIEQMGLQKTYKTLDEVHTVLFLVDGSADNWNKEEDILEKKFSLENKNTNIIFCFNKIDLTSKQQILNHLKSKNKKFYEWTKKHKTFFISAIQSEGIETIEEFLVNQMKGGESSIHLERHYELLLQASSYIEKAKNLSCLDSSELIAFELREVSKYLQMLLGETVDADVLSKIFEKFCIGK